MWIYHAIVFAGFGLMLACSVWLWSLQSSNPGPVPPSDQAVLFVLLALGVIVAFSGLAVRREALMNLAQRPCPRCGELNLKGSGFCRKCGAPTTENAPGTGPTPAAGPSRGPE